MLVHASLLLLPLILLFLFQMRSALGVWRGMALGMLVLLGFGGAWGALEWGRNREQPPPEDWTGLRPVPSETCFKCHEDHYASWHRTFHRTMTREATPDNVKADFSAAEHRYLGVASRLSRRGSRFFIETIDPEWEREVSRRGIPRDKAGPPPRREFSVDRLVGSHWFQQLLHRDDHGRYLRLPLLYHIVEGRWIHVNGAFLAPPSEVFHNKVAVWNETCVYCHNTRPSKNPDLVPGQWPGYRTKVGELGIACEACHSAGERHVRAHQNPARRLAQHYSDEPDPTIVNPTRLSVERSDEICARCHGGTAPRYHEWNRTTFADPYLAGRDLKRFWYLSFSEAEWHLRQQGQDDLPSPPPPGPLDSRFWGDGTPLTTALEYQGLALSACYQGGRGQLRCLRCHTMHGGDPNHQVKEGMRSNDACYGCHDSYRTRLAEHTHHAPGSAGSLCANCHMPYQVFSLLATHRSHRIAVPRVRDSLGTGKPHACNLCHLDKSLGWTQDHLAAWYGTPAEPLPEDERTYASAVLHLARSDARTRAIVAGAFGWPEALEASGRDWPTPLLVRTLEQERYEAVRYLLYRALRGLHRGAAEGYDYQGRAAKRAAWLGNFRRALGSTPVPEPAHYPYLPITPEGLFADDAWDRLLRGRNDPDVYVNE